MHELVRDLRHAVRLLTRKPGLSALAIISLALGIGVNSSMFTLVNALLLRELPLAEPEQVVEVYTSDSGGFRYATASYPDYLDLEREATVFSELAAVAATIVTYDDGERTELLFGEEVSTNFFDFLGLSLTLGRGFAAHEATPGAHPVVVLGESFWRERFGADESVLGRAINLNGLDLTVIGVAPAEYRASLSGLASDFWLPLPMHDAMNEKARLESRGSRSLFLKGRLRQGVALEAAQAELDSAWVEHLPLALALNTRGTQIEGQEALAEDWPEIDTVRAGSGYFETLGLTLTRGRGFSDRDDAEAPPVVVVNEALATRFWPGEDALGKRLRFDDEKPWAEVVGVARTAKYRTLGEQPRPFIYHNHLQDYSSMMTLVVASDDEVAALAALRLELEALDPKVPIFDQRLISEHLDIALFPARMAAALLAAFGGLGLVLASVGLYGVVAYSVSRRTREVGIRMAIGAGRGDVLALVVREGMALVAVGLALGLAAALAGARLLGGLLYGIAPHDPLTFVGVAVVLAAVALAANLLPARRATRVDPMVALRYE